VGGCSIPRHVMRSVCVAISIMTVASSRTHTVDNRLAVDTCCGVANLARERETALLSRRVRIACVSRSRHCVPTLQCLCLSTAVACLLDAISLTPALPSRAHNIAHKQTVHCLYSADADIKLPVNLACVAIRYRPYDSGCAVYCTPSLFPGATTRRKLQK
jgi:hypothetical protein